MFRRPLWLQVFCILIFTTVSVHAFAEGKTNVALKANGAMAIADSVYAHFSADQAIDGVWLEPGEYPGNNRWHSSLGEPHPHWVWIQFPGLARIDSVVIHFADPIDHPVDFVGEYVAPGEKRTITLFTVEGLRLKDNENTHERTFEPIVTNNFRLRVNRSSYEEHPNYAQISEIEVFGDFVESAGEERTGYFSIPKRQLSPTDEKVLTMQATEEIVEYESSWLRIAFSRKRPQITEFCWDNLGEGKTAKNLLKTGVDGGASLLFAGLPAPADGSFVFEQEGNVIRYSLVCSNGAKAIWEARVSDRVIDLALSYVFPEEWVLPVKPTIRFAFAVDQTPVSPLANGNLQSSAPLPSLLHASDFGTLLVESVDEGKGCLLANPIRPEARLDICLAEIDSAGDPFEESTSEKGPFQYRLSIVEDTHPRLPKDGTEERLAKMPRYWLNGFQYRADIRMLSNNAVSDCAIFCIHQYADLAVFTPQLPGGVEAIEMVRETVQQFLSGTKAYGFDSDQFMDTNPSQIIAAWDVLRVKGDRALLTQWLPRLESIADEMLAQDRNGNGLPESTRSGNRGEDLDRWQRTGNWWDCINFGHEDAYTCALAYRAFRCMADIEGMAAKFDLSRKYASAAKSIKDKYVENFYNPETGVIAGWRSRDGELHDYWFTFVNGIAIVYGLVPEELANQIIDRIQAKMREVGYDRFDLGLPGNLIPVVKNDYVDGVLGSPTEDDGSDSFGKFENGGASACFAYYYVQALYQLGRQEEGGRILWPMIESYANGSFQNGVGHGGEWTRWDGTPSGYEGFLSDAYYAQLALFTGYYGITFDADGFFLAEWSPMKGKTVPLGLRYMGSTIKEVE